MNTDTLKILDTQSGTKAHIHTLQRDYLEAGTVGDAGVWGHPALTAGERYYLITSGMEMDPPLIKPVRSISSKIQAYQGSGS